ncbi:MAG: Cu(I)-responsive transcriptional regulator [Rhodothermales bacterium]|jgi:Cu(I)-responsive transcriptional regulator
MNISRASELSSLSSKTIRYYEDIDLIAPARAKNGYRDYSNSDIHILKFLQRSRSLGFTIDKCRLLLSLYQDEQRASGDVKALAVEKIDQIDLKIIELQSLKTTLSSIVRNCHGDDKPDCPIIDDLAGKGLN